MIFRGVANSARWQRSGLFCKNQVGLFVRVGMELAEETRADVDPGGLAEEPEIITHVTRVVGRSEVTLVDGLHQIASIQVG